MKKQELIDRLNCLIKLDVDASKLYSEAIEKTNIDVVKDQFLEFQTDHEDHISTLSDIIIRLQGTPQKRSMDIKGFLSEGIVPLTNLIGTKGTLEAMEANEKLINEKYTESISWEIESEDVKGVLDQFLYDEQRHLEYIQNALTANIWEEETATH